jgi:uncharacterized membrane protein YfcA
MAAPPPLTGAAKVSAPRRWAGPAVGLIAGLASGLLGVGGGFLIVPLQVLWARVEPRRAVGTSLAAILPIGVVGSLRYYFGSGSAQADLRVALLLVIGSVAGAYLGAQSINRVPARELRVLVAATLAVVGVYEVAAIVLWPGSLLGHGNQVQLDLLHSVAIAAAGMVIGLLSGLSGIGGGVLTVPTLTLAFGLSQHLAQGTSLVAILPTAIVGAVTHYRLGNVDLKMAAWIGGIGAPSALIGASLALALPQTVLILIFSVFLLVAARQVWPGRPKPPQPPAGPVVGTRGG